MSSCVRRASRAPASCFFPPLEAPMGHPQMIQDDNSTGTTTTTLSCERLLVNSDAIHPPTAPATSTAIAVAAEAAATVTATMTTTTVDTSKAAVVLAAATPTAAASNGNDTGNVGGGACRRCRGEIEDPFAAETDPKIASEARAERVGAQLIAALKAQRLGEDGGRQVEGGGREGAGTDAGAVAAAARRRMSQLEAELLEARAEASKAEEMLKERGEACERMRQEVTRLEREACDLIDFLKRDEAKATSTAATAPSSPAAADTHANDLNSPLTPHALDGLTRLAATAATATAVAAAEAAAVTAVDTGRFQEGNQGMQPAEVSSLSLASAITTLAPAAHAVAGPSATTIPDKDQDFAAGARPLPPLPCFYPSSAPSPSPSPSSSPVAVPVHPSLSFSLPPQSAARQSGGGAVGGESNDGTDGDAIASVMATTGSRRERAEEQGSGGIAGIGSGGEDGAGVNVSGGRVLLSGVDGGRATDVADDRRKAAAAAAAAAAGVVVPTDESRLRPKFAGERLLRSLSPPSGVPVTSSSSSNGMGRIYGNTLNRGMAPFASSVSGTAYKEDGRRLHQAKSNPPASSAFMGKEQGSDPYDYDYDDVRCVEIPVGREDEGLLLGGGRVLHKLKEELGGTLEYRRPQGVVCVHGQQGSPRRAAACVRTALVLRGRTAEPLAEEYSLARLCMDDLLAECIALKGFRQAGGSGSSSSSSSSSSGSSTSSSNGSSASSVGTKGHPWSDPPQPTSTAAAASATTTTAAVSATTSPRSSKDAGSPGGRSADPWSPTRGVVSASPPPATAPSSSAAAAAAAAAAAVTPSASVAAAAAAAAAAVSVASNLPDGEYPPETASLRIIGEKYGCVIDVVGEAAADAAAAAVAASAGSSSLRDHGRVGSAGGGLPTLQPVGSATPIGHQDVLIWGPSGVVGQAKDAVAALVSGNASAEVVVGIGRIGRRDRGFWVNCETMVSGMSLEVDHKRGVAWVRGRPAAVEEGRKEFQNKLASLFPGDFLAVPMPRAALKDLANARGLKAAAAAANADRAASDDKGDGGGGDEIDGVELWADWPCSSVRLRGEPAVVRRAAKALYAALAQWNTLEVSVRVDRTIVTRLLSRSGRILAGISSNMGITLLVEREKGVLRGRARTEDDAKEANRVLKLKVAALSQRRSEQANSASGASAATTKGPLLSPGLSSTQSDRSGVSLGSNGVDDVPDDRDAELTDPFDELQAFFAGASLTDGPSSDGRKPASLKRSCVFDGVEDVPSGSGISAPGGGGAKVSGGHQVGGGHQMGGGHRTNPRGGGHGGGPTRSSTGAPSGNGSGSRNRGAGTGATRAAAAAAAIAAAAAAQAAAASAAGLGAKPGSRMSHEHHHQHQQAIVHPARRSATGHRLALSPSSGGGAGSPTYPPPSMPLDDGGGGVRRGGGGGGHPAFHVHSHGAVPSPPPMPSPPQAPLPLPAHAHHYHHQYGAHVPPQQRRHDRRPTWPLGRDEQPQQQQQQQQQQPHRPPPPHHHHSSSTSSNNNNNDRHHHSHSLSLSHNQPLRQPQVLFAAPSSRGGQAVRETVTWGGGNGEDMGAPLGYDTQPVGPADMYGGGGGGRGAGRGEVGGYPAPPSHPLVSSASEPLGGVVDGGGRGPFANHGCGPAYGNDDYDCADPAPHRQQRLVHWPSDDRGYARQSMATSFAVAETVGAVGRANGRGW